eukprot:m.88780 g.88780  ORF g.88780 m.88780 type:complete len:641 (-) comp14955_c0_seq1:114-2036(-)
MTLPTFICGLALCVAVATAVPAGNGGTNPKPHLVMILQDDLGFYDTDVFGNNPAAHSYSGNISGLAAKGIRLTNHYTHWHCSPTRRSFISGRLPIHHGEQLSPVDGDDIDLRMTWISEKLASAGYQGHWFGKGHTGYKSWHHLPANRGFKTHLGFLGGSQSYTSDDRWQNLHPLHNDQEFHDPPPGCNASATTSPWLLPSSSAPCDPSTFLKGKCLPYGEQRVFANTSDAADCCALCHGQAGCTHFVFRLDTKVNNCHIKFGGKGEPTQGQCTSGLLKPLPPPPSPPPGPDACATEYSSTLYGQMALQALDAHDPADPFFLYLPFQAVHTPYNPVPHWNNNTYYGMLWDADVWVGNLIARLKAKGMWDNTLIVYSSDNGGVEQGINYPLRGEKHSNWEGGMRTTAFVSGGLVPSHLQGTNNSVNMHIVDWYATFCELAGVSPNDDPPVKPLPVNISDPTKDIYGNKSYPPLDGVSVWNFLMNPESATPSSAHKYLALSKEVLIAGKYKLLVAQPLFKSQNNGWKQPDGTWVKSNDKDWPCNTQDRKGPLPYNGKQPCLFDLRADPGEHVNIADDNPDIVQQLWEQLNMTILTSRDCERTSCSPPDMIGPCNESCAKNLWGNFQGPVCDVPQCNSVSWAEH